MQSKNDPIIAEIRETRHRISEAFGHDPQKIIAHYAALQKEIDKQRAQQKQKDKSLEPVEA